MVAQYVGAGGGCTVGTGIRVRGDTDGGARDGGVDGRMFISGEGDRPVRASEPGTPSPAAATRGERFILAASYALATLHAASTRGPNGTRVRAARVMLKAANATNAPNAINATGGHIWTRLGTQCTISCNSVQLLVQSYSQL